MLVIFISYRHSDAPYVRALQSSLEARYGTRAVSRDIKTPPAQGDLFDVVSNLVSDATTVIVAIGRDWLRPADPTRDRVGATGDRDWVRIEVSLALAWSKEIVPVLLEDASMPPRSALPTDIAGVTDLLALRLRDSDWEADLDRLWARLGNAPAPETGSSDTPPSIRDAGPVAGRDVVIRGENVAGRDHFG